MYIYTHIFSLLFLNLYYYTICFLYQPKEGVYYSLMQVFTRKYLNISWRWIISIQYIVTSILSTTLLNGLHSQLWCNWYNTIRTTRMYKWIYNKNKNIQDAEVFDNKIHEQLYLPQWRQYPANELNIFNDLVIRDTQHVVQWLSSHQ